MEKRRSIWRLKDLFEWWQVPRIIQWQSSKWPWNSHANGPGYLWGNMVKWFHSRWYWSHSRRWGLQRTIPQPKEARYGRDLRRWRLNQKGTVGSRSTYGTSRWHKWRRRQLPWIDRLRRQKCEIAIWRQLRTNLRINQSEIGRNERLLPQQWKRCGIGARRARQGHGCNPRKLTTKYHVRLSWQ